MARRGGTEACHSGEGREVTRTLENNVAGERVLTERGPAWCACIRVCVCVCISMCAHVSEWVYVHMHVHVYEHVCVCLYARTCWGLRH